MMLPTVLEVRISTPGQFLEHGQAPKLCRLVDILITRCGYVPGFTFPGQRASMHIEMGVFCALFLFWEMLVIVCTTPFLFFTH